MGLQSAATARVAAAHSAATIRGVLGTTGSGRQQLASSVSLLRGVCVHVRRQNKVCSSQPAKPTSCKRPLPGLTTTPRSRACSSRTGYCPTQAAPRPHQDAASRPRARSAPAGRPTCPPSPATSTPAAAPCRAPGTPGPTARAARARAPPRASCSAARCARAEEVPSPPPRRRRPAWAAPTTTTTAAAGGAPSATAAAQ
ncbi:hypothetical protein BC834DRAFT_856483 [Gloeopeniophorella convolvens]|nr:hypothetical protein BC834DRAFT_856483 [Gloeopeniophorella convolvens]